MYNKVFDFLGVKHHSIKNDKHHVREYAVPPLTKKEIDCMVRLFKDDVHLLYDFLGREIELWPEFNK